MSSEDSASPPSPPSLTPTIRILHQNPFSVEDSSYSALEFFNSCEDAKANSNVTADTDKISFVRWNLKANSLAGKLMSASAIDSRLIKHDYSVFWRNFVEAFGLVQRHNSLPWIIMLADSLHLGLLIFSQHKPLLP